MMMKKMMMMMILMLMLMMMDELLRAWMPSGPSLIKSAVTLSWEINAQMIERHKKGKLYHRITDPHPP